MLKLQSTAHTVTYSDNVTTVWAVLGGQVVSTNLSLFIIGKCCTCIIITLAMHNYSLTITMGGIPVLMWAYGHLVQDTITPLLHRPSNPDLSRDDQD